MQKRIKKLSQDKEGRWDFPEGSYGHIRLWVEGDPPTPTDYWLLIGDYETTGTAKAKQFKSVNKSDEEKLDTKMNKIFKQAKAELKHYGKGKSFHMDVQVPKELIDGYAD